MTFTTKYEKGQKVWLMQGENVSAKPVEAEIRAIFIRLEMNNRTYICYTLDSKTLPDKKCNSWNEGHLFATKQELLDSL